MSEELRTALESIWGGGIDYALSPDFKNLTPDEKDALYIRYRDNLIAQAEKAIASETQRARINEVECMGIFAVDSPEILPLLAKRLEQLRDSIQENSDE